MSKLQVVNEIHRAARKNFSRRCVILNGINDLWQADLIDFQSFSRFNGGNKYALVVIDAFSKFAWVIPVINKTKSEIKNAFKKILRKANRPVNLQTDRGKEFYNVEFEKLMRKNRINHYSTFSSKKASIVERLIRTLKTKLYKYFSLVGNYRWVGKPLNDIVDGYNNTVHRVIKCKPKDVNHYNESIVRKNINLFQKKVISKTNHKTLQVGDYVRISKYKAEFHKGYTPNWTTEIFLIIKVNDTNPVTYQIEDQRKQKILGSFYKEELQKTNHPNTYLVEKVLRKKGKQLFVKWLGLNDEENSWINESDILYN